MNTRGSFLSCWSQIVKMAFPILLSLLCIQAMEVIDTIMIGDLGVTHLAAAAFCNSIIGIFFIVGTGFSTGVSVLVARSLGAKVYSSCNKILHTSIWINIFFALIMLAVLEIIRHHLEFFGQQDEVRAISLNYFLLVELSIVPHIFFQVYKHFTDGLGKTVPGTLALLCSLFMNILFNWIFIYGNWGAPKLGLEGAGLGTLLTRILLAIFYFVYLSTSSSFTSFQLSLFSFNRGFPFIKPLLKIGIPSSMQYFFEIGIFSSATIMAGWIDSITLASHQIALKIASICFMLPLSLSYSASINIGNVIGEKKFQLARKMGFASIGLTVFIMSLCGLALWLGRSAIPPFFIEVQEVLDIVASLIMITAIFQIFDGTQAVAVGVLRAYLDTKIPVLFTFVAYWLISFPSAYILAFYFDKGVYGLWYGLMLGLCTSSFLLNIRFFFLSKKSIAS